MSFETARYLSKATGRAKSDVANKLVSMFLHDLSRKVSALVGVSITDSSYTDAVQSTFGPRCAYCERDLERDRVAVEHLDGMNRYRGGLHVAGNVVVSCKQCNNEKRRDDSHKVLRLAATGWESFLSHDSTRCDAGCKTCEYWWTHWPDEGERQNKLTAALKRIRTFRSTFPTSIAFSERARTELPVLLERLYRDCQNFAATEIAQAIQAALGVLSPR